ncbi:MAG: hypothetical protein ACK52I_22300 [Pseudomonadota bacterium]|jgi:hypothetical protein
MKVAYSGLGLVPNGSRTVKPISASVLALVPKPDGKNQTIKSSDADPVRDTVPLIMKLAKRQAWQGEKLAKKLKGKNVKETVRNNWNFFFDHIQYKKDIPGKEQVRSLRRLVHNASEGGDCDCFVNGLSNLLINQGIAHKLRIAAYNGSPNFSHIYIVVPDGETEIILDPVVHKFNYEVPYSSKKDFDMKLESLDGIDERSRGCKKYIKPGGNRKIAVRTSHLNHLGLKNTDEILQKNLIPYTKTVVDEKPAFVVQTRQGTRVLGQFTPQSKEKELVNNLAAEQLTVTGEAVNNSSAKPKEITQKQAGTTILALLMLVAVAGSVRSNAA